MNFKTMITVAALALGAMGTSASALTMKIFDTSGGGDVLDTTVVDGTGNPLDGAVAYLGSVGGYALTIASGIQESFPPTDRLTSSLNVSSGSSDSGVRVEVSHHFTSDVFTGLSSFFASALTNFIGLCDTCVAESKTFIASSLFGTDTLVAHASGTFGVDSGIGVFTAGDYYVTQVFNVSGESGGTANAEFIAPVPVPAAGFLLLGGLGGLAALRRRKQKSKV